MSITHFPMYPSDWLAGTRGLSDAETGVYITLICRMYEMAGPIERDDDRLMRICGCKSKSAFVKSLDYLIDQGKIESKDGQLLNERVQKELKNLVEKSEKAKKAINSRWAKKSNKNKGQGHTDVSLEYIPQPYSGDTNHNHNHNQSITTNSTSKKSQLCAPPNGSNSLTDEKIPTKSKRKKVRYSDEFEAWWKTYHSKAGKTKAAKAFEKLTADERALLRNATVNYGRVLEAQGGTINTLYGSTFINERFPEYDDETTEQLIAEATRQNTPYQAGNHRINQLEEEIAREEAEAQSGIVEGHIVESETPLIGQNSLFGEPAAEDVAKCEQAQDSDYDQILKNFNTNR